MKKRLPEIKWNTIHGEEGSRQTGGLLPVIREYEENGHKVKVYPACSSVDLVGENMETVRANSRSQKIVYPSL